MNPGDEWEDPGNTVMNIGSGDPYATGAIDDAASDMEAAPIPVQPTAATPTAQPVAIDETDWVDPGQPAVGSNPFWPDL